MTGSFIRNLLTHYVGYQNGMGEIGMVVKPQRIVWAQNVGYLTSIGLIADVDGHGCGV